jgi:hypothetical protein
MGQATAFTVNDGSAVAHTFTPSLVSSGSVEYRNFAATYSMAQDVVNATTSASGTLRKVNVALRAPRLVVETVNTVNVPSVPDYVTFKFEALVPKAWGTTEISDNLALFLNVVAQTDFEKMVETGEGVY